jgi:Peptidase C10 family.
MKKALLLISVMAFAMGSVFAGPVGQTRAMQIGQRFMNSDQLQLVHTSATRGDVDYYVFNLNGGGFVIVAGDDCVKPILAYSTTGSFDADNVSDGFDFTLRSFSQDIQYVREHNIEATADIRAEWQSVMANGTIKPGSKNRSVVGPLCQTTWNQNFPYNSQCPEDGQGSGGHVYAGCVATAMAQVMKFWDYPAHGFGSYSYYPSGYPEQYANFGETEYHFELMPNDLDSLSTEEDYFYIAQFLHHCGVSVDMMYGYDGSGAYSDDVPYALRTYFGYNCDELEEKDSWYYGGYTNEEWAQMLKDGGLDEGMPLYYSGQDDDWQGGHAYVCDGYDENDYFHFNWGWSGKDDAWCPIGAVNTTKYHFNTFNAFIGHIIPNSPEYNNRPEGIADFNIVENDDMTSVTISWTNPSQNLNGEPLDDYTVYVYRDREVIFQTEGVKGSRLDIQDMYLEPGLYNYSIIAENEYGFSKRAYAQILVGDKCDIVFELTDDGGDGWKGACISVTDENGNRIAKVTMTEGSEETVVMPLLTGNLNFIWNHGWFHTNATYDTDYECHFTIYDANGTELFVSGDHSDGVFLTHDNNCDDEVNEVFVNVCDIYPNPTKGILNVEGEGEMTISVLNVLGQKVLETTATDNTTLDMSGFETGIYMVRIETAQGTMTEKVSVRR